MAQSSITSYFNTKKRAATEDLKCPRNKVFVAEEDVKYNNNLCRLVFNKASEIEPHGIKIKKVECTTTPAQCLKTRSARVFRNDELKNEIEKSEKTSQLKQQNLVKFIKKGNLSPFKKCSPKKDAIIGFTSNKNFSNVQKGPKNKEDKTATDSKKEQLANLVKQELKFDEVKSKITRSEKLQELKASLSRLKELEKKRKLQEEKYKNLKTPPESTKTSENQKNLKKFNSIEFEVLTSPQKGFKTPVKSIQSCPGNKNSLLSSTKEVAPNKILFSPTKDGSSSKFNELHAYQKFKDLVEVEAAERLLQLPYNYRCLLEIFRCVDSVCAMFFNRKEMITFKKLKPAVQRMLRKNFNENHLAQIKQIYPDAFNFTQVKMRNFGSTSKQDYYQLVITPKVNTVSTTMAKIDEEDVFKVAESNAMNPQVMIERIQKFSKILINIVKNEHDNFLKSLNPPLVIPKEKITRWHPEFDLNSCPDIEKAILPQPPNIEKFSSAKDVLSTARNLFNCQTPIERAMTKYEVKMSGNKTETDTDLKNVNDAQNSILKGVPKALLDRIRAKQAAKALDSLTRTTSEVREATRYSRLPDLARHLRHVFITEKKGVLPLEVVLTKIENSFKTVLSYEELETHIRLLVKEHPDWITFHDIRNTVYLKLDRNMDFSKIIEKLKKTASEKFIQ